MSLMSWARMKGSRPTLKAPSDNILEYKKVHLVHILSNEVTLHILSSWIHFALLIVTGDSFIDAHASTKLIKPIKQINSPKQLPLSGSSEIDLSCQQRS